MVTLTSTVRKEVGTNDQIRDFFLFFRWNREICRWIGCEVRGKGFKGKYKVFGVCNWVNGGFGHKYGRGDWEG